MPKRNTKKNRKDIKEEITADNITFDPKYAKTQMERMKIIQEVENKLHDNRLENELATRILNTMMNDYLINGTRYINKELSLDLRSDMPRKYIVNLYNDRRLMDQVYIKAKTQEEIAHAQDVKIKKLMKDGKTREEAERLVHPASEMSGKVTKRKTGAEVLADEF